MHSGKKQIAKNTLFLYLRMILVMLVTLYTSREILRILGIDDYGVYQVVGGIVGFLTFINVALSTGTSRFLTFELGTGDDVKLRKTFLTSINVHILIAIIITVLSEIIGVWLIPHKLKIPAATLGQAIAAFHWSIATVALSIITAPYNASIIAHEKMNFFAYIGIFEVFAKLGVVFGLSVFSHHRLEIYAGLLCMVQLSVLVIHMYFCRRHFKETRYKIEIDWNIFREIAIFSGWSLFSASAHALNNQGILILINLFFSPAIVAARAVSLQVNTAVNQFVNNFRTAVNPQIVKLYASHSFSESRRLLLESTKYSFYLMLLLCMPLFFLAKPILSLWLVEVPPYTVPFLQIVLVQSLVQVFDNSFYIALYAKGQLKQNAILSPSLLFLIFPIVYLFFKQGFGPLALSWVSLLAFGIIAFVVKPYLLVRIVDYPLTDILTSLKTCLKVFMAALPLPALLYFTLSDTPVHYFIIGVACILSTVLSEIYLGVPDVTRRNLICKIKFRCRNL